MRQTVIMFLLLTVGALVQSVLPGWPMFAGVKPPVLVALVLHYALKNPRYGRRRIWVAVFWAALLHDGLTPGSPQGPVLSPFGPAILAFPLIAILANRMRENIFADTIETQAIGGAAASMILVLFSILFYLVTGIRPVTFTICILQLTGALLFGVVVSPVTSLIMKKIEARLPGFREVRWP